MVPTSPIPATGTGRRVLGTRRRVLAKHLFRFLFILFQRLTSRIGMFHEKDQALGVPLVESVEVSRILIERHSFDVLETGVMLLQ